MMSFVELHSTKGQDSGGSHIRATSESLFCHLKQFLSLFATSPYFFFKYSSLLASLVEILFLRGPMTQM